MGKISEPGNSPFSLTGQPSACGTAREVGTFAHRLPADMVVMTIRSTANLRAEVEAACRYDSRTGLVRTPCCTAPARTARSTSTGRSTTNNMQAGPNVNDEIYPGMAQSGQLRFVVSDCLPDRFRLSAT